MIYNENFEPCCRCGWMWFLTPCYNITTQSSQLLIYLSGIFLKILSILPGSPNRKGIDPINPNSTSPE